MIRTNKRLNTYWHKHYVNKGLCSLCGNSGKIDTTHTAISAVGVRCGRVNYCICPNGQTLRKIKE